MDIKEINKIMTDNNISKEKICHIIVKRQNNNPNSFLVQICKDYSKWSKTDAENYLWEKICQHYYVDSIVTRLLPVETRKWSCTYYNNGNPYIQDVNKDDIIYVESEFEGQYGRQLWISTNNYQDLFATPTRKGFAKLEVGKFYKVTKATKQCFNGGKRFIYNFEEVDEETFLNSIEKWWDYEYWKK